MAPDKLQFWIACKGNCLCKNVCSRCCVVIAFHTSSVQCTHITLSATSDMLRFQMLLVVVTAFPPSAVSNTCISHYQRLKTKFTFQLLTRWVHVSSISIGYFSSKARTLVTQEKTCDAIC